MSVYSLMSFLVLVSLCLNGVQLLEISENVESYTKKSIRGISAVGGWGLPDRVAIVGKIFRYKLPSSDSSCGNFTDYQVSLAGTDDEGHLPSWLFFNKTDSSLEGVPRSDFTGLFHVIQVTANCTGLTDHSIREHFTIKISAREEPPIESTNEAIFEFKSSKQTMATTDDDVMLVRCGAEGSVTTATVTIDADESLLTAVERLMLLRRLSSHLGLPETLMHMAPFQERPVYEDSALVAGPGDTRHPVSTGLLVQWDVGCGNVFADHMPVLEHLEVTSSNGAMGKAIGYGVVGWHITSKRPNQRRLKRRAYFADATATPIPSAVRPSVRTGPTVTITETDSDVPETRIVPTTRTSLAVPGMTRTQVPPVYSSPSKEPSRVRSTVILTKSPTPTTSYVTITPTRVLSTVAASTMTSTVTIKKSTTPSLPVDGIEPSIFTEGTVQSRSTATLPSLTAPVSVTPSIPPVSPKVTRRPPKTQKPSISKSTPPPNRGPVVLKPLPVIEAFVGKELTFQIPDDTFSDDEGIESLSLLFLKDEGTVTPSEWIQFNATARFLHGLALEENVGEHYYELAAADKHNRLVKTECFIRVKPDPATDKANNEFSVTLDYPYEKVKYDLATRMNLINKIAAAFGDNDSSKMTITKISPGSVVITWTNNTLPLEPCPQKELEALLRHLLTPDGQINETFAKAMEPYKVTKAEGKFTGSCDFLVTKSSLSSEGQRLTTQVKTTPTTIAESEVDVKPRLHKSDNLLLYILVPLLIFFLLLLLIIIVCVLCYRKQRRRQKEEDKLTGLHKGIPIIFADELEEKQETPASTLKFRSPDEDGRQSVPPPEYPSSKPGSKSSTLRSDYKSPLISDDDDDDNDEEKDGTSSVPPETLPRRKANVQNESASTTTPLLHYKA